MALSHRYIFGRDVTCVGYCSTYIDESELIVQKIGGGIIGGPF